MLQKTNRTNKKIQPDVIHLHNLHGYYVNIEILFNFLTIENTPVVWTLHDCWPITGHCSHFDYVGCEKWKTECYSCPQKKMYPASFLFDNSRQNYSLKKQLFTSVKDMALVPVSNWMADILKQSFLQKYPIEIIHNGINLSQFKPANGEHIKNKYQLENKFIILGVASVWKERKGLKDFVELSISLDKNFQIVLVGLSAHQIKSLPENIIGINKTENVEELVRIYSIADVFVNPTWEDTFPTTNVESLACGTPVITYKTGGSPEAIDATVGIVVEKGNINGLVQAVKHVQKRGNKYYTNACVERVRQFYNKDDQYKDYLNLYNKLLHND